MDAAHGRAAPGGTFFAMSMKDASKCLVLLAMAHMIDQEPNLSWADMIRFVYTHFDLRLVEITPTGASMVRETLPLDMSPTFPVEGGIGLAGMLLSLICLTDLDKGLLNAVALIGDMLSPT